MISFHASSATQQVNFAVPGLCVTLIDHIFYLALLMAGDSFAGHWSCFGRTQLSFLMDQGSGHGEKFLSI